ncbi:hypothetical protein G6F56_001670 [Rhizopus delemar]|uniref:BZIP domain-containing protein n=1 Tax=Rhizopus stolonifer TaxID=4846 RepID=A0A367KT49_RHIST|nr:hypothetical protein G6F56_001670 [Rhizopus delemar]RCI05383.1 hypothetical protein CU098_012774 [Rhizopus stolonifer]
MTEEISPKPTAFRPIAPSLSNMSPSLISSIELKKRNWNDSTESMPTQEGGDHHSRRKEQNRAAQRAFRERKEKYVKELEDKIGMICAAHASEVEKLKKENQELRSLLEAQKAPESSIVCVRDKTGISFCERLKEEVCSNAYNQLLTEPLFDSQGYLNEAVTEHPVPIVTSMMRRSRIFDQMEQSLSKSLTENDSEELLDSADDLISCSELWKKLQRNPLFDKFDIDELCAQLKSKAMCSQSGPVFSEREVKDILKSIEEKTRIQDDQVKS